LGDHSPANLDALADAIDYFDDNFIAPLGPLGGELQMAEMPLVSGLRAIAGAEELSAAETSAAIASTMSPRTQRSVTIAVTETEEGIRVISSSEGALRPAARRALNPGEIAVKGKKGVHAEANGMEGAKKLGLTPTGTAASRPICPNCAANMKKNGVAPLSPLKRQKGVMCIGSRIPHQSC
jgi:hypothetical protein